MSHANLSLVSLVSKALLGSGNGGGALPQCNLLRIGDLPERWM